MRLCPCLKSSTLPFDLAGGLSFKSKIVIYLISYQMLFELIYLLSVPLFDNLLAEARVSYRPYVTHTRFGSKESSASSKFPIFTI